MHTLHMLCTKNKSIFDGSKDRLKKILIQYSKLHGKKPFVGPFLSPKNLNSTSLCLNCLSCTSKCCSVCSLSVMNVKNADFSKLKNRFVFRFCVSKFNLFQFQLVFLADINCLITQRPTALCDRTKTAARGTNGAFLY